MKKLFKKTFNFSLMQAVTERLPEHYILSPTSIFTLKKINK